MSLNQLNPPQREAVLTTSGPLLVLAGAGTGKTRVITYRMAELIRRGVSPDRILSVTFTNKAAREMQERTTALLGSGAKRKPVVSTFHSLCVRILREEIEALGYPKHFTIYDRGDQESAVRKALRDARLGESTFKPADVLAAISRWKMRGILPDRAADHLELESDALLLSAYRRYQTQLKNSAAVDFDDLLLLTNRLFNETPDVLERHQRRYDHIQIDEYQDTNEMQFDLMSALVRPHKNICVVGDDDQSIYGWRGAEVRHILGFPQTYPGAKVIRLEDNYRCTDEILGLANSLVSRNRERHPKTLRAHKAGPNSVRFFEYEDDQKEAELIVQEIAALVAAKKAIPSDFAILVRTNEQPRVFETELRKARVPYVIMGTQSFFDRKEIRDLLSYLKVFAHPQDEISLLRIINTPSRGIGDTTVEKILQRAVQKGSNFWSTMTEFLDSNEISKVAKEGLQLFRRLVFHYQEQVRDYPRQLPEVLEKLIEDIDYDSEIDRQYPSPEQQEMRRQTLGELVNALTQYVQSTTEPTLENFLEETSLTGRDEEPDKDKKLEQQGVRLMTLHSSKGLEFSRVYLVGLEEGILPHKRSIDAADEVAIEEERRLAYVGVTRAQNFLALSWTKRRMKWGKPRNCIRSRFLYEMKDLEPPVVEDEPRGRRPFRR